MAKRNAQPAPDPMPEDDGPVTDAELFSEAPAEEITATPDDSAETSAPEVVAESTQELSPPPPSLRDLASQHGFQVPEGEDDATLFQRVLAERQRDQQLAQQYQQLAQYGNLYLQQQQQAAAQQQAPQQPAAQPKLWDPPPYQKSWLNWVERDQATGQNRFKPDTPVEIRTGLTNYLAYQQDFEERFRENPEQVLAPFIEQRAAQLIDQRIEQRLQQDRQQGYIDGWLAQNADWVYEKGPDGRPRVNPLTGQREVSQYGQQVGQFVTSVQRAAQSPQDAVDIAMSLVELNMRRQNPAYFAQQAVAQAAQAAPAQQPAPAAVNQQKKQALLHAGAARTANRNGSFPVPETNTPPQNGRLNFGQMFRQDLAQDGITDILVHRE